MNALQRRRAQVPAIPRSGLVCHHRLWTPNVLLQSNSFGPGWTGTRATAVESATVTVPGDASRKAWKPVEDNTAGNTHYLTQTMASVPADESPLAFGITAKGAERTHIFVGLVTKAGTLKGGYAHLHDGSTSSVSPGYTLVVTALGDDWYRCVLSGSAGTGASAPQSRLSVCDESPTTLYDGTGSAPYTEADPGLYIADAQLYPSATLPPYVQTTTLQTWADLSGRGVTLQRGATANAEASDPTVLGPGMSFVTDDYMLTGNLAGVNMAGDWTAIVAGLFNSSSAGKYPWSVGSVASDADFAGIRFSEAGKAGPIIAATVGGNSLGTSITVSGTSPEILVAQCVGGAVTLKNIRTGENQSTASKAPAPPSVRIGVGCLAKAALSPVDALTAYEHLFYNRVLTAGEIRRAANKVCDYWAQWGVSIARPL
jgi:hypothetical protein